MYGKNGNKKLTNALTGQQYNEEIMGVILGPKNQCSLSTAILD
jgi:hypothetical protein